MSKDIKKPAGETRRYVGIDLGDKKSRVCILDERGEIVLQEWVVTTPEAFFKRFHGETKMDIAMEVGAHSRWASDLLGRCGHKGGHLPIVGVALKRAFVDRSDLSLVPSAISCSRMYWRAWLSVKAVRGVVARPRESERRPPLLVSHPCSSLSIRGPKQYIVRIAKE